MSDDIELLAQWCDGDVAAGNVLVRRHFALVYRFFRNKVPLAASDLAQQTFLALVEQRTCIQPSTSFAAYLLGVARRKLVHHLRHHYGRVRLFSPTEMFSGALDPGTSPTRRLANVEHRELLNRALNSLPLDHQIVLELHYWQDMKLTDIAAVLECNPNSIKSRLYRARGGLRRAFERLSAPPDQAVEALARELSSVGGRGKTTSV